MLGWPLGSKRLGQTTLGNQRSMIHEEFLITVGLCLLGSMGIIFYSVKKESDKFENSKKEFDDARFVRKNKWDFGFYVVAGFIVLTFKSVVNEYIGIEGITDHGLSCLSGLLGSFVVEWLFNKRK